jgi:tetratricopeptide (TPR) repeat protein
MYRASITKTVAMAMIIVVGFVAVVFLSEYIESEKPVMPDDYADSDLLLRADRIKGFAFGMDGLIADMYYMRALQYVGDKIIHSRSATINIDDLRDLNPRLLYPLLNSATDLDPHFVEAYLYGAIVLPAIDPQNAIAIADKGVANNPNEWRIYRQLGYIHWKLGNYDRASEVYEKGSEISGAPGFMHLMAAAMKTKGGSRETARAIYREMLNSACDDNINITAERRLEQLDSLDDRDAIDRVLTEVKETSGRCPNRLAEILPKLTTVKLPENHQFRVDATDHLVDPTGAPYLLDTENCRVQLDTAKSGIAPQ